MGFLDIFKGKKAEPEEEEPELTEEDGPTCSLCGKFGANKKYGGQMWHKKCLRKGRKMAKGMI